MGEPAAGTRAFLYPYSEALASFAGTAAASDSWSAACAAMGFLAAAGWLGPLEVEPTLVELDIRAYFLADRGAGFERLEIFLVTENFLGCGSDALQNIHSADARHATL
jgi:hypothetical protein